MRQRKQAAPPPAVVEAVQAFIAKPAGVPRGVAEILPTRRRTDRASPKIAGADGEHRVYVEVGSVGGRIVEVWIDVAHREGSVLRGWGHALARVASQALQHGMPIDVLIRSLVGSDGGPGGAVLDCAGVTKAESIPDLVGRVLAVAARAALPPAPEPVS
jgi:hypothetical protein